MRNNQIPPKFLDPLRNKIMLNPVKIKKSGLTIDKTTAAHNELIEGQDYELQADLEKTINEWIGKNQWVREQPQNFCFEFLKKGHHALTQRSSEEEYDLLWKIAVIGPQGSGVSNLCSRFARNEFCTDSSSYNNPNHYNRTCQLEGKAIKLQIWPMQSKPSHQRPSLKGVVLVMLTVDLAGTGDVSTVTKKIEGFILILRKMQIAELK